MSNSCSACSENAKSVFYTHFSLLITISLNQVSFIADSLNLGPNSSLIFLEKIEFILFLFLSVLLVPSVLLFAFSLFLHAKSWSISTEPSMQGGILNHYRPKLKSWNSIDIIFKWKSALAWQHFQISIPDFRETAYLICKIETGNLLTLSVKSLNYPPEQIEICNFAIFPHKTYIRLLCVWI